MYKTALRHTHITNHQIQNLKKIIEIISSVVIATTLLNHITAQTTEAAEYGNFIGSPCIIKKQTSSETSVQSRLRQFHATENETSMQHDGNTEHNGNTECNGNTEQ